MSTPREPSNRQRSNRPARRELVYSALRELTLTTSISVCITVTGHATTLTWDGNGGTGTWDTNTSTNWWNGSTNVVWPAPGGANDDAIFGNTAGTVSIAAGGATANDLTFNTTGYLIQNNTLTLNGATPTITTASGVTATINSVIAGTVGLTKADAGTLTLSGNNSYTGTTTVSGGTLIVDNTTGGTTSMSSSAFVINGTSTLLFKATNGGGGRNDMTGKAWSFDATGGGTINSTVGNWLMTGTVTTNGGARNTITGSNINMNGGSFTFNVARGTDATSDLTVTSGLGNTSSASAVTKNGSGILSLSGSNSYSGATIVNNGTLSITEGNVQASSSFTINAGASLNIAATNVFTTNHGTAMASTRVITVDGGTLVFGSNNEARFGNVTLKNGATWTSNRGLSSWDYLLANTSTGAATVTVANTGGNTTASVMNGTGGIHLQGVQNFDVADVTGSSAADLTVSMTLGGPGSVGGDAGGITKLGAGTMLLTGNNSFTGGTTINGGTLAVDGINGSRLVNNAAVTVNNSGIFEIRGVNALPTGGSAVDVTVNAGGVFRATSGGSTAIGAGGQSHAHVRNLTLSGGTVDLAYSGGGSAYDGESFQLNGDVTVNGSSASTIQFGSGGNATTAGVALAGNRSFTVNDATGNSAADLIVSAELENSDVVSTLTKLGAGTLSLNGASTYTGTTTVSAGTLLVNGSLGNTAVAVSSNAIIGGTGSIGGSLSFDGNSFLAIADISDALAVTGSVSFGAGFGIDNLIWDYANAADGVYTLIAGNNVNLANLENVGLANAYNLGNGHSAYFQQGSLQMVVVPEPAAALLGALGLLPLLRRRRSA